MVAFLLLTHGFKSFNPLPLSFASLPSTSSCQSTCDWHAFPPGSPYLDLSLRPSISNCHANHNPTPLLITCSSRITSECKHPRLIPDKIAVTVAALSFPILPTASPTRRRLLAAAGVGREQGEQASENALVVPGSTTRLFSSTATSAYRASLPLEVG